MRVRKTICLLLGLWLGASFLMLFVATQNFRVANDAVQNPPPAMAPYVKAIGQEGVRQLVRYQASESNRDFFEGWGAAQFLTALVVFLVILFATSAGRFPIFLSLAILILVGVMQWVVNPQIAAASRVLDFVPLNEMTAERMRMRSIHNIYSTMEVIKLVMVGTLAAFFLFAGQRRPRAELR
jgi:preprotein translocase subunit SecG